MIIWKTNLPIVRDTTRELPAGAKFLDAQNQDGQLCLWFLCDPDAKETPRTFRIVGTGKTAPEGIEHWEHIGTVQDPPFVWHVFVEPEST